MEELRARAEEVVNAEYKESELKEVDTDSYFVWQANEYWVVPWEDEL